MPFTYVQQATTFDGTQVIFPSNNAGSTLIASFGFTAASSDFGSPGSLVDSAGNTWEAVIGTSSVETPFFYLFVCICNSCVASTTPNTLSLNDPDFIPTDIISSWAYGIEVDTGGVSLATVGDGCESFFETSSFTSDLYTGTINENVMFGFYADAYLVSSPVPSSSLTLLSQITGNAACSNACYGFSSSLTATPTAPFTSPVSISDDGANVFGYFMCLAASPSPPPPPITLPVEPPPPGFMTVFTMGGNSYNMVGIPTSPGPSEIELGMNDSVAVFTSPFTQVQQTQQWPGGDFWDATITLPSMYISQSFAWEGFLAALRGKANVFQLGDTRNVGPMGTGLGVTTTTTGTLTVASVSVTTAGEHGQYSYTAVTFTVPVPSTSTTFVFSGLETYTGLNGETLTTFEVGGNTAVFNGRFDPVGSGPDTGSAVVTYQMTAGPYVNTTGVNNLPMTTSLVTNSWAPNQIGALLPGDKFQVGYRLYRACEAVNSDSSGNATITVWPSLRETPANATPLILTAPVGLFRLQSNRRAIHWSPSRLTTVSLQCVEAR